MRATHLKTIFNLAHYIVIGIMLGGIACYTVIMNHSQSDEVVRDSIIVSEKHGAAASDRINYTSQASPITYNLLNQSEDFVNVERPQLVSIE